MDVEQVSDVVERISRVPDRYRRFDHDADIAWRIFRLDGAMLSAAADYGLPVRSSNGQRAYDELDLTNLSLALRLPSPRYLAMYQWPAAMRAAAEPERMRYEVDIAGGCAATDSEHTCDVRLTETFRAVGAELDPHTRKGTLIASYDHRTPRGNAPDDLRRLFNEVDAFHFHVLPVELYSDLTFLRDTALANCELASKYLVLRGLDTGWDARRSFGLLLSTPYSIAHFWAEFRLDGEWVAFDPHMINSLARWGLLDPETTARDQVVSAAVLRIGDEWTDLIEDAGHPVKESLLTRRRLLTTPNIDGDRP